MQVHSARRCLGSPSVLDGELEPGATGKMWCYCCEKEIEKHVTDGSVSIEWGGLLEHMAEYVVIRSFGSVWWTARTHNSLVPRPAFFAGR